MKKIQHIVKCLNEEIDQLISQGITNFISSGAIGFDLISASAVIAKKQIGASIQLILAFPCQNQDKGWQREQKRLYHSLLAKAYEILYISEEYTSPFSAFAGRSKQRKKFLPKNKKLNKLCKKVKKQSKNLKSNNHLFHTVII